MNPYAFILLITVFAGAWYLLPGGWVVWLIGATATLAAFANASVLQFHNDHNYHLHEMERLRQKALTLPKSDGNGRTFDYTVGGVTRTLSVMTAAEAHERGWLVALDRWLVGGDRIGSYNSREMKRAGVCEVGDWKELTALLAGAGLVEKVTGGGTHLLVGLEAARERVRKTPLPLPDFAPPLVNLPITAHNTTQLTAETT